MAIVHLHGWDLPVSHHLSDMESVTSNPETAYDNLLTGLIFLLSSCESNFKEEAWFRKFSIGVDCWPMWRKPVGQRRRAWYLSLRRYWAWIHSPWCVADLLWVAVAQSWASASFIPPSTSVSLAHILPSRQSLIKCPFIGGLLSLYLTSVLTIPGLSKQLLALPSHLESISVSVWRLTPFSVSLSLCLTSLCSKDFSPSR